MYCYYPMEVAPSGKANSVNSELGYFSKGESKNLLFGFSVMFYCVEHFTAVHISNGGNLIPAAETMPQYQAL